MKQDRQGVRQAAELERKYNLGSDSQAMSIATDAKRTAERAESTASNSAANVASLNDRVSALESGGSPGESVDLGLSVVNGMLCVTYENGV